MLAKTDKLHSKLHEMSQRIRQLEDALKISHAATAHGATAESTHPLLTEELLAIKAGVDLLQTEDNVKEGVEGGQGEAEAEGSERERDAHADAVLSQLIGTLAISDKGGTRFVGNTGAEVGVCLFRFVS